MPDPTRRAVLLVTGLCLLACSRAGRTADAGPRDSLVEGRSKTTLVLGASGEDATITAREWRHGAEVARPEAASGRIDGGAYVHPDGSRVAADAQELAWPPDSRLGGAVFTAAARP